jgi:hypothetical protein
MELSQPAEPETPAQPVPAKTALSDRRMLGRLKRHLLLRLRAQQRRLLELIAAASTIDSILPELERLQGTIRCFIDDIRKVDAVSRRISGSLTPSPTPHRAAAPVAGSVPQTPPTPAPEAVKPSRPSLKTKRSSVPRRAVGDPLTPRALDLGSPDALGGLPSPQQQRLSGESPTSPTTPWTDDVSCTEEAAESIDFDHHEWARHASPLAPYVSHSALDRQSWPHRQPEMSKSDPEESRLPGPSPAQAAETARLPCATRLEAPSAAASRPPSDARIMPRPERCRVLAKIFGGVDVEALADVALHGASGMKIAKRSSPCDARPPSSPLETAATNVRAEADALADISLHGVSGMRTAEPCSPRVPCDSPPRARSRLLLPRCVALPPPRSPRAHRLWGLGRPLKLP